jgi:hypothetical protein
MKLKVDPGRIVQLIEISNIMIMLFQNIEQTMALDQPVLKTGSYI